MTAAKAGLAWKGLQTDRKPVFISCDQVERMLAARLDRLAAWRPGAVIGIARGGLIPATMLACALGLPLFALGFERRHGRAAWIGPAPTARRLLLVDDSCSSGTTLRLARTLAEHGGAAVATLAIVHDPDLADPAPDFSTPMRDLFRLPWERGEATPPARAARVAGTSDPALETPFYGVDLDGVHMPAIADRAVVITSRPETDRALTQAWLTQAGHGALPLECRPADIGHGAAEIAAFKAGAATRWGCTHFVESDPEQALRIAALAPHLIVGWWSAEERRMWIVGCAEPVPPGAIPE